VNPEKPAGEEQVRELKLEIQRKTRPFSRKQPLILSPPYSGDSCEFLSMAELWERKYILFLPDEETYDMLSCS